jgi:hypothetical protein
MGGVNAFRDGCRSFSCLVSSSLVGVASLLATYYLESLLEYSFDTMKNRTTTTATLLVLLHVLLPTSTTFAFQTPSSSRGIRSSSTTSTTARHAVIIPPEAVHSLLTDSAHAWSHLLNEAAVASTATAASTSTLTLAADVAAEVAKEGGGGWWASYLNIFKSALLLVHSTIDGPLRSVGFTQTWGLSIAIFTACK